MASVRAFSSTHSMTARGGGDIRSRRARMVPYRSWPSLPFDSLPAAVAQDEHRQARADGLIDRQRTQRHMMIADPADHRNGPILRSRRRPSGAMTPVDTILPASFEYGLLGSDDAAVNDADQIGQLACLIRRVRSGTL